MLQAVRLLTEMARTSDDRSRGDNGSISDAQASSSTSSSNNEAPAPVLFREIHKTGWLRRTDANKPDKDSGRSWVTFCVHDDADPKLEGFADQKQASLHSPFWSQSLRNAVHLSPTLCATSKNDYEFCVNFSDDQILRLAAPTYQAMLDWVQVVTRKLTDMKVLKPKENLYSRGPERIATRDPTSPLPPPPSLGNAASGRVPSSSASPSTSAAPSVFTFDEVVVPEDRRQPSIRQPTRSAPPIPTASSSSRSAAEGNSGYESVFLASSYSAPSNIETARPSNTSTSRSQSSSDEGEQYAALIEYRTSENPESLAPAIRHQTRALQLTLREQQVLQLRKEMGHPAGVRLKLGRRDCKDGIAFVDCFGAVWIAGWKYKDHPLLYNVLHIGDLVLSIAGIPLNSSSSVKDILKNYTFPRVEMIVRRLPHGRVATLTKRNETEDFGLEVGTTNEVISVTPVAQSIGLSSQANPADPSADVGTTVTWTITEVNNRPLNLFEGNARERLNALGRDASVVLQPSDLICTIRKKLRAVRSYKNFVLQ